MDVVPNAEELAGVFSVATGPAFFLGATAALISIILGQLNTVLERIKEVSSSDVVQEDDLLRNREVDVLYRRLDTLGKSLYLLLGGGICTLVLLAFMSIGAWFKIEQLYGAGLLFLIANFLVGGSLFMFAMDVRIDVMQVVMSRRRKNIE